MIANDPQGPFRTTGGVGIRERSSKICLWLFIQAHVETPVHLSCLELGCGMIGTHYVDTESCKISNRCKNSKLRRCGFLLAKFEACEKLAFSELMAR